MGGWRIRFCDKRAMLPEGATGSERFNHEGQLPGAHRCRTGFGSVDQMKILDVRGAAGFAYHRIRVHHLAFNVSFREVVT